MQIAGTGARTEQRLLEALVPVVARVGYANLTVQQLLEQAQVSRATFYQYFASAEDCFWSSYRAHAADLAASVAAATRSAAEPELACLQALASFVSERPDAASLLLRECLAAGPTGLVERDSLIAAIEREIAPGPGAPRVDLPGTILVGGAFRFLTMQLSSGEPPAEMRAALSEWVQAFTLAAEASPLSERLMPSMPAPDSGSGVRWVRPGGPARERLLLGTALAVRAKGYHSITVADIVAAAGVSRRRFYNEFPCKADAFIAAYEFGFQRTLAACTPAFFNASEWRERVWEGGIAFTAFMAREPLIAHLGFLECYALGPRFNVRVHDTQLAFTLFLEEGYRQRPPAARLSRAISSLTAATIFEVAFQASRRGPTFDLRRCQPLAVYIALGPFIGLSEAGEFVLGKLALARRTLSGAA